MEGDNRPLIGSKFFWACRLTLCLCACLLAACNPQNAPTALDETDEPRYRDGKQLLREGKESEALSAFLKVIDKREEAPQSHLEAGEIYLEFFDDPIAAIHHYRRFLAQWEDAPHENPERARRQAENVRARIDTAVKRFAASLPGRPFENDVKRLDLLDLVRDQKQEIASLKQQLASARARARAERERAAKLEEIIASVRLGEGSPEIDLPPAPPRETPRQPSRQPAPAPAPEPEQQTGGNGERTYTVQPQDSLYSIARKVYGDPSRWRDIFEANRDILPSEDRLRVGQTLRIPE